MILKPETDKRAYIKSKASMHILICSFVCFSLMGFFIYRTISADIVEKCISGVRDIVSVASAELDGDTVSRITSEDSPEYQEVLNTLTKYKSAGSVKYIYLLRREEDHLSFIVDADDESTKARFGEEYPLLNDMKPALEGTVCNDSGITADKWGSYISAYAPVFSSDGTVSCIAGADTNAEDIENELNILKIQILVMISVFYIICLFFLYTFLSSVSKHDMLTGILNYDTLVEKGNSLSKKNKLSEYSVLQLNIRNFKYINSKIGTSLGDVLLIQYAGIIFRYVESDEYCARTGSDNFLLLIKKGREDDLIETLSETWIDLTSYGVEEPLQVSVRCGIYEISDRDSMQDAVNYSSVAIKQSRLANNNFITKFESSMLDSMVSGSNIISDFHRALDAGEFHVYYQPKVDISTSSLCGAEALVRWIKDGKVIPPADFIPVLEAEGLITEVDFLVFETVCRNICEWEDKGITPVPISSNFSKLHLANPNFAESVLTIVRKYGINPDVLEIELTESSGYSNYDALTEFVRKMNNAKIHTSIDDFGTGYSSLSMLKDINVDVVKIDKSFLAKTDFEDIHQEKMLENVIKMINDLDRTVICEGIENESQLDFLKHASCSVVQGYFFDKPLPHDEFEKRLISPHYNKKKQ